MNRSPGRPPIDPALRKIKTGYKLQAWLIDWLRDQDQSAARIIEEAIIRQHKLKPPIGR